LLIILEAAGITQRQLSKELNIAEVTLNTWVAGKKMPRFDNAVILAKRLNVSLKVLAASMRIDTEGLPDK
jgi:transcriptional regulator with XRE-family HTH domain